MENIIAAGVIQGQIIVRTVGGKIAALAIFVQGKIEIVVLRIVGYAHVRHFTPLAQSTGAVENVVVADAQVLIGTEVQRTSFSVVKRGYLVALRIDAATQIDRRIVFALPTDGIPDVQSTESVRAIGDKIQNAMPFRRP